MPTEPRSPGANGAEDALTAPLEHSRLPAQFTKGFCMDALLGASGVLTAVALIVGLLLLLAPLGIWSCLGQLNREIKQHNKLTAQTNKVLEQLLRGQAAPGQDVTPQPPRP